MCIVEEVGLNHVVSVIFRLLEHVVPLAWRKALVGGFRSESYEDLERRFSGSESEAHSPGNGSLRTQRGPDSR